MATHQDTGYNSSAASTSLGITLSAAVSAGDLLVLAVNSAGAGPGNTSVSDTAGNTWTDAYNGQLWYCASSAAAAGGLTVTATTIGGFHVLQMMADRFTPGGAVTYGGFAHTGAAGTLGLNYNTAGCGDLGTVPAGALAWGAFTVSNGAGDQAYTAGFQTGTTAPVDVVGSQFKGANGSGVSVYVLSCANEDATPTWYGTGTGAIGSSGSMYFTIAATVAVPAVLPAVQLMPPGLASPAAWQFPQYRPLPLPPEPVAPSTSASAPLPAAALPAAPVVPPGPFTPMSAATRRAALPPVSPPATVTITTTGATFSPVVALTGGSTATVTWACPGFTSQTGLTPSFSFGSAASRAVTVTVTGGGGFADVTLFNLGYDNTIDAGTYMPPSGDAKSAELVSGISGVNLMTGLIYFLADRTALATALDFTGMAALQFIQCYGTGITGVTLSGCTALKRLQVEACNLTTLDLNPVAGNLYDLRAAVQQGGTLTFVTLTSPMAVEYHYCVRDQTVINSVPLSQLPVIYEYWTWNTGLSGALAPSSSALFSVQSYSNHWTSADFTNQFPGGRGGLVDLHANQITSVNLTGCSGLLHITLSSNSLNQSAVDGILAAADGFGTSNGTLDLRQNTAPSGAGTAHAAALTARGWTVNVDSLSAGMSVALVPPMPPGLASPAAWQFRPLLPPPEPVAPSAAVAPPPPYTIAVVQLMPPGLSSPAAWQFPQYLRLGQTVTVTQVTVGTLTASDTRLGGPT